jgi:hypothetical protein
VISLSKWCEKLRANKKEFFSLLIFKEHELGRDKRQLADGIVNNDWHDIGNGQLSQQ